MAQGYSSNLPLPLTVSNGGTGVVSNTAYSVLCGGTTGTGPIQSVASVGSAGQILTSNGIGALPTFQNRVGFFARLSSAKANVTGDGTAYTIPFDVTKYDTASQLNTSTGVYTITKTGIWSFGCSVTAKVGSGHTAGHIYISQGGGAQNYFGVRLNFAAIRPLTVESDTDTLSCHFETNLSVNDTISAVIRVFNSTKTVEVIQSDTTTYNTFFYAHYVGPI